MLRTSLIFAAIALIAALLADFEISTLDPWTEIGRMVVGVVTPDFLALWLQNSHLEHGCICPVRHLSRRPIRHCLSLCIPIHRGAALLCLYPRDSRDFLGLYFSQRGGTQSDLRGPVHCHSIRGYLRQSLCGNCRGIRSSASGRYSLRGRGHQPLRLWHSAGHL